MHQFRGTLNRDIQEIDRIYNDNVKNVDPRNQRIHFLIRSMHNNIDDCDKFERERNSAASMRYANPTMWYVHREAERKLSTAEDNVRRCVIELKETFRRLGWK